MYTHIYIYIYLGGTVRLEVFSECYQQELECIPNLVTEVSEAYHSIHIQVNIMALCHVPTQSKPHGIRATGGNTVRVIHFLKASYIYIYMCFLRLLIIFSLFNIIHHMYLLDRKPLLNTTARRSGWEAPIRERC